jgi:small GTP-binding protein
MFRTLVRGKTYFKVRPNIGPFGPNSKQLNGQLTSLRPLTTFANILSEEQQTALENQKDSLNRIHNIIKNTKFDNIQPDLKIVNSCRKDLDDFFLIAVTGQFNVGKSTFINTLLGDKFLETGITPTTSDINYVRYGTTYTQVKKDDRTVISVPVDWLKTVSVVDTPGLNSLDKEHDAITSQFIPRSDIVFFLISSTQTLSDTEHNFIQYVKKWKKDVVVVMTKIDSLEPDELNTVKRYLESNLKTQVQIFYVSSKVDDPQKSGFDEVQDYINNTLDDREKIKLKYTNANNICDIMLNKYQILCQKMLNQLMESRVDTDNLKNKYIAEMNKHLQEGYNGIDLAILKMRNNADKIIDENVRITNFRILFNKEQFSDKFNKEVVEDTNVALDKIINDMVEQFNEKSKEFRKQVELDIEAKCDGISKLNSPNRTNPKLKYKNIMPDKSVHLSIQHGNSEEINQIVENIRNAFWTTVTVELAAIFGIGTIVLPIETALLAEPSLFTGATIGAGFLGLVILPWKKGRLKKNIKSKADEGITIMKEKLNDYFNNEINICMGKINGLLEPYQVTTLADTKRFTDIAEDIKSEAKQVEQIKQKINHF